MESLDLFGNPIQKKNELREMFGENPFQYLTQKAVHGKIEKESGFN